MGAVQTLQLITPERAKPRCKAGVEHGAPVRRLGVVLGFIRARQIAHQHAVDRNAPVCADQQARRRCQADYFVHQAHALRQIAVVALAHRQFHQDTRSIGCAARQLGSAALEFNLFAGMTEFFGGLRLPPQKCDLFSHRRTGRQRLGENRVEFGNPCRLWRGSFNLRDQFFDRLGRGCLGVCGRSNCRQHGTSEQRAGQPLPQSGSGCCCMHSAPPLIPVHCGLRFSTQASRSRTESLFGCLACIVLTSCFISSYIEYCCTTV